MEVLSELLLDNNVLSVLLILVVSEMRLVSVEVVVPVLVTTVVVVNVWLVSVLVSSDRVSILPDGRQSCSKYCSQPKAQTHHKMA